MKLSDFDYPLPPELIAVAPVQDRTQARLLHVPRSHAVVEHKTFSDLPHFLNKGDVLVLNDTRVLAARLIGRRPTGGRVEALLIRQNGPKTWEVLLRSSGRIVKDTPLSFGENGHRLEAVLCDAPRPGSTRREMHFEDPDFFAKLEQVGHMPLPPYLKRKDGPQDRADYQTVYARVPGAAAAPTAGLHFDQPLLEKLAAMGVEVVFVTLHAGYGTFQSITAEDIKSHQIFEEEYEIPQATADAVNRAKQEGRRILACGTTSVRALESAAKNRVIHPGAGQTRLFIYPPYSFQIVDGLITNFHLPKSSLLLLAAAFLGDYGRLLEIYREAIRCRYRFYSYGDAMLIL